MKKVFWKGGLFLSVYLKDLGLGLVYVVLKHFSPAHSSTLISLCLEFPNKTNGSFFFPIKLNLSRTTGVRDAECFKLVEALLSIKFGCYLLLHFLLFVRLNFTP